MWQYVFPHLLSPYFHPPPLTWTKAHPIAAAAAAPAPSTAPAGCQTTSSPGRATRANITALRRRRRANNSTEGMDMHQGKRRACMAARSSRSRRIWVARESMRRRRGRRRIEFIRRERRVRGTVCGDGWILRLLVLIVGMGMVLRARCFFLGVVFYPNGKNGWMRS